MANATTSYSDWARNNQATVNQVVSQQSPVALATPAPAPITPGTAPVFDADEYAKAQASDAKNDAIADGQDPNKTGNNIAGKVLGLVGAFFGGPIGAALGAAGGMFGKKDEDQPADGGDGSSKQRSNVAQGYLSSFLGR